MRAVHGVVFAALAAGLVAQDVAVAKGEHFELHFHGGDERVARQALAVVEPVWPLVCEVFGADTERPEQPLEVHLYRDVDGYLAADRKLTGGRFGPNQAMSHWNSKSAHVAMQPPCADAMLARHGLPLQTEAMLAWEACHIVRFELCSNFRSHPGWFHDGLAATIAQRALQKLHPKMGEQPFFTQRWWRVRRLADEGDLLPVRLLLTDETHGLSMRDRYAERIAFFEFAQQKRARQLRQIAEKVRTTGGGTGYAGKVSKAAVKALGGLDAAFRRRAASAEPVWDEQIRSIWCLGDDWRQRAFADSNAVAFRTEGVRGGRFRAKGQVCIYAGKKQQMNFLFARTDGGFYSLAITAGYGWTLFDHRFDGNVWNRVGQGRVDDLRPDTFVPFELVGKGKQLELKLGEGAFEVTLPRPLPDEIRWGVGAQAGGSGAPYGSVGVWRNVQVR